MAWFQAVWRVAEVGLVLHKRTTRRDGVNAVYYYCCDIGSMSEDERSEEGSEDDDIEESDGTVNGLLDLWISKLKGMRSLTAFSKRHVKSPFTTKLTEFFSECFRVFGGGDIDCSAALVAARGKKCLLSQCDGVVQSINNLPDEERKCVLQGLQSDGFSRPELQRVGFVVGKDIFSPSSDTKHGRPTILTEETEALVRSMFEEESTPLASSNKRLSRWKGQNVQNAALNKRKSALFKVNSSTLPFKRSTFYSLSKRRFQNYAFRKRKTDYCEYCYNEQNIRSRIQNAFSRCKLPAPSFDATSGEIESVWQGVGEMNASGTVCTQLKELVNTQLCDLRYLEEHQLRARKQREAYKLDIGNPGENLVMELDYKQKGSLPMLPVETSGVFYHRRTYSHLGVGTYWKEGSDVHQHHYDFVMDNLHQDSYTVIQCLNNLFKEKKLLPSFKKLVVWCDVGRHFQSKEMVYYLLFSLVQKLKVPVCLNFFCEKHGKNGRDSHFGVVSRHLDDISRTTEIITVSDVAAHLSTIQHTTGIEMCMKDTTTYTVSSVDCSLFTAPFCWFRKNTKAPLLAALLSGGELYEVKYTIEKDKTTRETKRAPDIPEESDPTQPLSNRSSRMRRFVEQAKKRIKK